MTSVTSVMTVESKVRYQYTNFRVFDHITGSLMSYRNERGTAVMYSRMSHSDRWKKYGEAAEAAICWFLVPAS